MSATARDPSGEPPVAIARRRAAAHPGARLPCPVCAAPLGAARLERHLGEQHPDAGPTVRTRWTGKGWLRLVPCTLALDGSALVLHRLLGLRRRTVSLPCTVDVGAVTATRLDPVMTSYADDMNIASSTVRAGWYLRVTRGDGATAITIGCAKGPRLEGWAPSTWRRAPARRSVDLWLPRDAVLELEYQLAARDVLVPAPAS